MVQRIMNTVEKTSTGVTPVALKINNSIRPTERILLPPTQARSSGQFALSDKMDEWIARQCTLINVAREKQRQTDFHALVEYDPTLGNWLPENNRNLSEFWRQTAAQLFYDRFRGVSGANSSFAAISEVFWELIAPNLMIFLLFRSNLKYKIILKD